MSLEQDVPLLAGLFLLLVGSVYALGVPSIDGLGDFQDPIDVIRGDPNPDSELYKVDWQFTVGSTATGDTFANSFTCQVTEDDDSLLSIADTDSLAIGGANNVKASVKITNSDSGKVYVDNLYRIGEIGAGQSVEVDDRFQNAAPGTYRWDVTVNYDPEIWDDKTEISKTFYCQVGAEN